MASPNRIAWDSCAWIAHIQQERIRGSDDKTITEDRGAMCRAVLAAAENGALEIVVSALALVEVISRNRAAGIDDQKVRDYFDNNYILLVNVDKRLGDFARRLMLAGMQDSNRPMLFILPRRASRTPTSFTRSMMACLRSTARSIKPTGRDWSSRSPPCQPRRHRCSNPLSAGAGGGDRTAR